jgi:hypothetical protein
MLSASLRAASSSAVGGCRRNRLLILWLILMWQESYNRRRPRFCAGRGHSGTLGQSERRARRWAELLPSMVVAWAHGAREGGAPLVVLALLLAGVVALETVGRGVVALVRRLG